MRTLHRGREAGFSLMEMTVVVGVAAIVLVIAYQVLEESYRTAMSLESRNDLNLMAQRPANAIQTAIYQARTVFDNDAAGVGQAYYNRIVAQLPAMWTPAPGTLLPILAPTAVLNPDAVGSRTIGNCLLVARQMPPLFVNYDHDSNSGTPMVPFPIDRYRFEMFYLRQCNRDVSTRACAQRRGFGGTPFIYDLARVRTIDFADYFQLNPLVNNDTATGGSATPLLTLAQRQQIAAGLASFGLTRAWNPAPGQTVTTAFYTVTTSGTNAGRMAADTNPTLTRYGEPSSINPQIIRGTSIAGSIQYSIAFRNPAETENTGVPFYQRPQNADGQFNFLSRVSVTGGDPGATAILRVPRFAASDVVTATFPSGFEVRVGGVGAGQRVLVRTMIMARFSATRFDAQESVVVGARGLSL